MTFLVGKAIKIMRRHETAILQCGFASNKSQTDFCFTPDLVENKAKQTFWLLLHPFLHDQGNHL
jgi:hypothetical protein